MDAEADGRTRVPTTQNGLRACEEPRRTGGTVASCRRRLERRRGVLEEVVSAATHSRPLQATCGAFEALTENGGL